MNDTRFRDWRKYAPIYPYKNKEVPKLGPMNDKNNPYFGLQVIISHA